MTLGKMTSDKMTVELTAGKMTANNLIIDTVTRQND